MRQELGKGIGEYRTVVTGIEPEISAIINCCYSEFSLRKALQVDMLLCKHRVTWGDSQCMAKAGPGDAAMMLKL